jgi:hypothetical protein
MVRRSTWIFLAVFLFLLGALLIFQRIKDSEVVEDRVDLVDDFDSTQPVKTLFQVPSGEVILGLEIIDRDENKLEILRKSEYQEWVLISFDGDADQDSIDRVISQLESMSIERTLNSDIDLDIIGIADPAYTIRLLISNGGYFTIYIGNVTITNTTYYTQLKGSSPVLVSKYNLDTAINLLTTPPVLINPIETIEPTKGNGE